MIQFEFWGTSHGEGYGGVIRGLPQGASFFVSQVNKQLAMRKQGYGRSSRQSLPDVAQFEGAEGDRVTIAEEVRFWVPNSCVERRGEITALRSGHSDVVGVARFPQRSARELAELSSARSSLCYVVLGSICKQLLVERGIFTFSYVEKIGGIASRNRYRFGVSEQQPHFALLHCPCRYATQQMCQSINRARAEGNSLGGIVAVGAVGVPMGIGEISPYHKRLDAVISANLVGIPSVKGISFGLGDKFAASDGVSAHDELEVRSGRIEYATNKCGGIVAGITTGGDILCHLVVKPVPTVKGVSTVDSATLATVEQHYERADTCVVPNVGVVAENILAYVIANQMTEQGLLK